MIPSYIIDKMESEWQKAIAYAENFMEEIKQAPFSYEIKHQMLLTLKCNIELLEENEKLTQRINKLEKEAK